VTGENAAAIERLCAMYVGSIHARMSEVGIDDPEVFLAGIGIEERWMLFGYLSAIGVLAGGDPAPEDFWSAIQIGQGEVERYIFVTVMENDPSL
jgi:hypothetical protein